MAILPAVSSSAMHGAVVPIAYKLVSSTTSSIAFSNIPQGYQDLYIVINGIGSSTGPGNTIIQLNSDTGSNYSNTVLNGNGSSASSARYTSQTLIYLDYSGTLRTTNPSTITTHILNYANSSTYKTVLARSAGDNNGSGETNLVTGLWRNTSAITALNINGSGNSFAAGTTIELFGIRTVGQ
jgi:hypothetical protein